MTSKRERLRKPRGRVELCLMDARTGEVLLRRTMTNVVTVAGEQWILARLIAGGSSQLLEQIAFGTDDTAAARTDVALGGEIVAKLVGEWDTDGLTADPAYIRAIGQLDADEGNDPSGLSEIGLKLGNDTLFSRSVIDDGGSPPAPIAKTESNVLAYVYTISWPEV